MPLQVYRLRRLLAATAVLLTLVVAGMYFYARSRATNVLKQIPGKIGYDIKQTASGFQFSKSDGKRTLFTVQASDVKEFKLNGNAELHNVSIVLYGRDSSRFDQIYGDDFAFDQKTGDVTAKGNVQIDLVANPAGLASPDQSTPKQLKNPIHLKTQDLVFNKDSGNAMTAARVEFRTPQATGWAIGVKYAGKSNTLTLSSQIHVVLNGPNAAVIEADHGIITNDPREIVLDHPHLTREGGALQADQAVFHLGPENHVERVLATGNVTTETRMEAAKRPMARGNQNSAPSAAAAPPQPSELHSRADQAEFLLAGKQDLLRTATLTGSVHIEQTGPQPMQGDAGRVILDFAGRNQLQKVHAVDGVRLTQNAVAGSKPAVKAPGTGPPDFELLAPIIDFTVVQGHILDHAVTSGAAQIAIAQAQESSPVSAPASSPQRTVVTAGKFQAQFSIHRRPKPSHQCPRLARRAHRQLDSRPARPRQHQRFRGRHFPSAGRHRFHHATRQRRLHRRAGPRQAHASLGKYRALYAGGPDARPQRQSARSQRRHGDDRQDHPHQPRYWRRARRG